MSEFSHLIGQNIKIQVAGEIELCGRLIDAGLDILVIYNKQYYYLPFAHVQRIKPDPETEYNWDVTFPSEQPLNTFSGTISYRKVLMSAKGIFVCLNVEGNRMIHGYLTSIMNDYFVFYSPAHKVMYISMNHVKWLIPYIKNATPYSLSNEKLPVNPIASPLARTFTEQCKRLENNMVILDNGDHPEKIGLLKKAFDSKLALVNAEGETVYWNCHHLKTLHLP